MNCLSPSILSADFANLGEQVRMLDEAGAQYVHIDVMDGMFVPSISFGMPVIKSIRECSDRIFDVHLMIEEPGRYIDDLAEVGADLITVHAEACKHLDRTIEAIKEKGLLSEYPDFEVYLDSPLAIEATKVFTKNMRECFDEEALALVNAGINPLVFPGLHTAISSEDSKMINFIEKPKVIISASGMCDAGRIRHHLKHNLWREECTILFVGYQANGTLGRRLLEGEKNVKLFGESIEVHARIESLHGVSGHADMNGLLKWVKAFDPPIQRVFVVHGEDTVTEEFAKTVEETFDYQAFAPFPCAEVDLLKNEILSEGVKIPVKAKKPAQKKADAAYDRLTLAGKRLMDIIYSNAGLSNKDKAKFEAQINNLADKWEL